MTATADKGRTMLNHYSGSELAAQRVVMSGGGAADVLFTELNHQGPPGEIALGGKVATRTSSGWALAHKANAVDGPHLNSGRYVADVAAGSAGDALYVEGHKPNGLPPMNFSARLRAAGETEYLGAAPIYTGMGTHGDVRGAPLTAGRYLVLLLSAGVLRSSAGTPASVFGDQIEFSGTDSLRLLGLAGAPIRLAAAAWVTTGGQVQAAVYDDSLRPGALPPPAARDDVAPLLSRLAVTPKRFTKRRRASVRWRLSEPARVRLRVERKRVGFRRGGRCVARRPQTGRVRRCTRFRHAGTLTRVGQAGQTAVRFDRFVRRRGLRPGRYRVTALPRDAAGNRGLTKRARFTILRRR